MLRYRCVRIMLVTIYLVSTQCIPGKAQQYEVAEKATVYADVLDNCYVVEGDRVTKLDSTLNLLYRFRSANGSIEQVDASDPFKLLLFQKDFFRITFLDNTLTSLGESLFLPEMDVNFPLFACNSTDGGFWVFDGVQEKLLFFRNGRESSFTSSNLSSLFGDGKPTHLCYNGGLLFLGIENQGIAVFDKFGGFKHLLPTPEAAAGFVASYGKIYFADGAGNICSVNTTGLSDKQIVFKKKFDYQGFAVGKKCLFFVSGNKVSASRITSE